MTRRLSYSHNGRRLGLSSKFSESLLFYHWSHASFVQYLNLIDYHGKQYNMHCVPWIDVPFTTAQIVRYCRSNVLNAYKLHMLGKLEVADKIELSSCLPKLLRVSKLLKVNSLDDEAIDLYYKVISYLCFKEYECTLLITNVWEILCVTDCVKISVFENLIGSNRVDRAAEILRYILKVARAGRFPFWGLWISEPSLNCFPYCPVTSALLQGDLEQISSLLQYGFQQNYQRLNVYDRYFLPRVNHIYKWLRTPLEWKNPGRKALVTEVLLFLIRLKLCTSCKKKNVMIKCFHLLWDTTCAPYVTKTEIQKEIHRRFSCSVQFNNQVYGIHRSFPKSKQHFLAVCNLYDDIFIFKNGLLCEPRSLSHLCRYTIRKQLFNTWNLPNGIQQLPVSRRIKSYIMLENI